MKRYINPLWAILLLPLAMTSCFNDDDEDIELSENCYISDFSLGSLKRSIYGKTLAGEDSIYTVTFASTNFPMSIDQRRLVIENLDSLPVRTNVKKVLVSATFQGILVWRKPITEGNTEPADTAWTTYSSTDSLDLSEPLHFHVLSASGLSGRTYTVRVNVHQQMGDSTTWNALGTVAPLTGLGERRAVAWNGQLTVMADNGNGLTCVQHPLGTQGEWTATAATGTEKAVAGTLQKQGDRLLLSTTDGALLESRNATEWTDAGFPTKDGLRLVAASEEYAYALADGKLYRSNGGEWEEEKLDDKAEYLPTEDLNSVFYTLKNGTPRLTLVGTTKEGTESTATVWAKSWDKGQEASEGWTYYTPNAADKFRCPLLENLCVVPYDNGLQALGGKSRDGRYEAMDSIFHSSDHGISWKTYSNNDMDVDPALKQNAQAAKHITATTDDEHFLWVVTDDKVWRGRINRLGFKRN